MPLRATHQSIQPTRPAIALDLLEMPLDMLDMNDATVCTLCSSPFIGACGSPVLATQPQRDSP
jgi:hypothetical protein